ncbi:MAG: hypothetical protein M1837_007262 [Sclerophora amabilis]|nr:MAG: hypothetical protein M1837_007262 [Sclerophora amabilis]
MARFLARSRSQREKNQEHHLAKADLKANPYFPASDDSPAAATVPSIKTEITAKSLPSRSRSRSRTHADRPKDSNGPSKQKGVDERTVSPGPLRRRPTQKKSVSPVVAPLQIHPSQRSEGDNVIVGMAIGSPREASACVPPRPQTPQDDSGGTGCGVTVSELDLDSPPQGVLPPRDGPSSKNTAKWKIFGGFFGKKPVETPAPAAVDRQQRPPAPSSKDQEASKKRQSRPPSAIVIPKTKLTRTGTKTGRGPDAKTMRRRSEIKRSNTDALSASRRTKNKVRTPEKRQSKSPVLQVEIPSVEMERYSVMFGSLLKPTPQSLLVRRQANLEKVKITSSVEEEESPTLFYDDEKLYPKPSARRATSPASITSPFCALFPSPPRFAPNAAPFSHRPTPVQRSQTAPPGAVTPTSPGFNFGTYHHKKPRNEQGVVVLVHSPARDPRREGEEKQTSAGSGFSFSSHDTFITANASDCMDAQDEVTQRDRTPLSRVHTAPVKTEPASKMVTESARPRLSPRSTADAKNEESLIRCAAEASIARQITVSQRQLLLPVVPRSERLVNRQPMTANLVTSRNNAAERRSQLVELDSV